MKGTDNDIEKYHKGMLTPAERHALEKKALSDPFLADALEGAGQVSPDEFSQDLKSLHSKINPVRRTFTPLRIAAGVLVVIAAGWATLYILNDSGTATLLTSKNKQLEQSPASKDSAAGEESTQVQERAQEDEKRKNDQLLSLRREAQEKKNEQQARLQRESSATGPIAASGDQQTSNPTDSLATKDQVVVAEDTQQTELAGIADTIQTITQSPVSRQGALARSDERQETEKAASGASRTTDMIVSEEGRMSKKQSRAAAKEQRVEDLAGQVITGKVTLADDGLAVPGVNVRVKGTSQGTVTDLNGNYSLQVEQPQPTLVFSFIGLQTQEVTPSAGPTLDVKLAEDVSQLSEVVVTGAATPVDLSGDPVVRLAEPVGGLRAYDRYLEGNLRYPKQALDNNIKGKVGIQFRVGTDGALKEFRVTRSLGFGCDEEVIRLVKEGPAWIPSAENNIPTESIVRVRLRFDPSKSR
jgi:hypothetical protein